MINAKYNHEENILHVKASGNITCQEIVDGVKVLKRYAEFTNWLLILEDSRESILQIRPEEIPYILSEIGKIIDYFDFVKHADIQCSPRNTAFAMMYEMQANKKNYSYKIFYTSKAAKNWLIK